PPLPERLEETCLLLNSIGLDSKKFIQGMLTSTDSIIARRRGSWGTEKGWISKRELLDGFKALIFSGNERWSAFILKEAKEIVIRENLPSGDPPDGMFHSSKNVTHEFFLQEEEQRQDSLVEKNMPFLHSLVSAKLGHARDIRQREREKRKGIKQ
ncbi:hypothetical protein DFH28DRAFT_858427, partial [Melampsora americana]